MWMDNFVLNLPKSHWPQSSGEGQVLFRFFESARNVVVLANSNNETTEVDTEACTKLGIKVLRRKGGGGTVVLMPGCLILTFAFYAKDLFSNNIYFEAINRLWIESLQSCGVSGLSQGGISDIVAGDKKVAGTSLFRKKHLVVYQGSLLVEPDFNLISQCLKHPSREPDYRNKRTHEDFLTSLSQLGCKLSTGELAERCQNYFAHNAAHELAPHLF